MHELSEILGLFTIKDVNSFLRKYGYLDLETNGLVLKDITTNWELFAGTTSNSSVIGTLDHGDNGIIERITNGIDAVIQKEKDRLNIKSANHPDIIVKKTFPKYYEHRKSVATGESTRLSWKDAGDRILLVVNDGSSTTRPTFDVIDTGTGIHGTNFKSTILSLNHGNKISSDKGYLIGAFGQGGSTSMRFSNATIIISKVEGKYFFTIIKMVELRDIKVPPFVFLSTNGEIMELSQTTNVSGVSDEVQIFLNAESGTLVRMVDTDISKRFRDNEVTKPGKLIDFINTTLFGVGIPVKVADNRIDYRMTSSSQDRYSYGSLLKIKTSEYIRKEYTGSTTITHKNRPFQIDYYVLLPIKEDNWGLEGECKTVFSQFNVTLDPIIYTINGQTVSTEKYTKLNNAGLSFLKYRLLVVIDLDSLGTEKYRFITTDRTRILRYDLTDGFLDAVVKAICNVDCLKEINERIAELSVDASVDQNLIDEISKDVKKYYLAFATPRSKLPIHYINPTPPGPTPDPNWADAIIKLVLTSKKREFFKDESMNFVLETGARRYVNAKEKIDAFVDGKSVSNMDKNSFNGRVQLSFPAGDFKPDKHKIQFAYAPNFLMDYISTDEVEITILDQKTPDTNPVQTQKGLNLKIMLVNNGETICEVAKNEESKEIFIKLFMSHDSMKNEIYGKYASLDTTKKLQKFLIKPIALFALFSGDAYDSKSDEEKNKMIISLSKSFVISKESMDWDEEQVI